MDHRIVLFGVIVVLIIVVAVLSYLYATKECPKSECQPCDESGGSTNCTTTGPPTWVEHPKKWVNITSGQIRSQVKGSTIKTVDEAKEWVLRQFGVNPNETCPITGYPITLIWDDIQGDFQYGRANVTGMVDSGWNSYVWKCP